jgi:hypothetical protein
MRVGLSFSSFPSSVNNQYIQQSTRMRNSKERRMYASDLANVGIISKREYRSPICADLGREQRAKQQWAHALTL